MMKMICLFVMSVEQIKNSESLTGVEPMASKISVSHCRSFFMFICEMQHVLHTAGIRNEGLITAFLHSSL